MSVQEISSATVAHGAETVAISQFFAETAAATNPAYLVVTALDRNEYTAAGTGATGSFSGNGATLGLSSVGGDGRGAGIVYTWQPATGQYVNTTYGTLNQLAFTTSSSLYDVTSISLFGTSNQALAQGYANDAYAMMQADPSGYIGSTSLVTDPNFTSIPPAQATPSSIAALAASFVGHAWNDDGCWILASVLGAESGAGLPVQSTAIGVPGHANGEWYVRYDGPVQSSSSWQSLVGQGDIIAFGTPGGGGHITTCLAGQGSTAMLVDNITYVNQYGQITNPANDGSASDILISPPHPATQEWSGVAANQVVIYALDTPAVTDKSASTTLTAGATLALSSVFSASDPAGRSITEYQVSLSNSADKLIGGTNSAPGNGPLTVASLSGISVLAATQNESDTVSVRAYNGSYWGDWQSVALSVVLKPPVLTANTPAQSWQQGSKVSLALPPTLFTDPQHEALTYSASSAGGGRLPSWLNFNAVSRTFSGTVPSGIEQFSIAVTAADSSGLSASETFVVTVPAAPPVLAVQTPTQSWAEGSAVTFALPSGTFADPQGQALSYRATLASGAALPSWLSFNTSTGVFSGTPPGAAQTLQLKVTATDASKLSASETFDAVIAKATSGLALSDWANASIPSIDHQAALPPHLLAADDIYGRLLPHADISPFILDVAISHHA